MRLTEVLLVVPPMLASVAPHEPELLSLGRELGALGFCVTIVIQGQPGDVPPQLGLARRLDSVVLDMADQQCSVEVDEGVLASGGARVLVARSDDTGPAHLLALAHKMTGKRPDVVVVDARHEGATRAAKTSEGTPLVMLVASGDLSRLDQDDFSGAVDLCDRVVLSSAHYAHGLLTGAGGSAGELVRQVAAKAHGIRSGIDAQRWNPRKFMKLPPVFRDGGVEAKAREKKALQADLDLQQIASAPLVACLSIDGPALPLVAESITSAGAQLVVATPPQPPDWLVDLSARLKSMALLRTRGGDRERKYHHLLAAAEFQLIDIAAPATDHSRLCGVPFGAVPIGPRAFELADCIVDFDPRSDTGTGFLYAPEEIEHCRSVVRTALATVNRASLMRRLAKLDVSWTTAAVRYADLIAESRSATTS